MADCVHASICTDPRGVDRNAIHCQIAEDAVEFFDETLRKAGLPIIES